MLSRIANSMYWMSRYLERADNTARLLEINLHHMVEAEDVVPEASLWRPLLSIGESEESFAERNPDLEPSAERVLSFLTDDRSNPISIISSLRQARENARVVRDRISKEMWECLNELWLSFDAQRAGPWPAPHGSALYQRLRAEIARFHGLTVSTMMRGEPFAFYLLGTFNERADMSARILDVKYHLLLPDLSLVGSPVDYYQWAALLKSLSGFDAYRRQYHGEFSPLQVAEFVILEPEFPRSLRFCVDRMCQALTRIGGCGQESPSGQRVAALKARLSERSAAEVFRTGLHEFLDEFLDTLAGLGESLTTEFFAAYAGEQDCAI